MQEPSERSIHTIRISDFPIPRAFEKLLKLESYDGATDPDEHVEHIDTVFNYLPARGVVKCKLFAWTLKGAAMMWFKA